jgi:hypothetical protein
VHNFRTGGGEVVLQQGEQKRTDLTLRSINPAQCLMLKACEGKNLEPGPVRRAESTRDAE